MADVEEEIEEEVPEDPTESARHEFPCENCGANMRWDPEADALSCEYCQAVVAVPRAEGTVVERALSEAGEAARGLGLELRVARCQNCGAQVTFEEARTAEVCVYCGSATVLEQEANRNAIRPESLVPLDVSREGVEEGFREWIGKLWFRPNDLKKVERFTAVGIYAPFWTFDCQVHSEWSADAGYYYWVTQSYRTRVNGRWVRRTRRVRKVRWVPAWGNRDDVFDDLLVVASKGLPPSLVEKLGGFDTQGLVPYRPEYLAGWRAEEYQVDLDAGWTQGQEKVVEIQRRRCSGDVPGDTQRNLRVQNHISGVRWKHVLLPVWSLQYIYRKKTYTVLVNGQTGRVVGDAPYSWVKIGLLVFFLLAVAAVVIVVAKAS